MPQPRLMTCQRFLRQHRALLDGELSQSDERLLQDHLLRCHRCARLHTALRRGLMLLAIVHDVRPSPTFRRRLSARLRAELVGVRVVAGTARTKPTGAIFRICRRPPSAHRDLQASQAPRTQCTSFTATMSS